MAGMRFDPSDSHIAVEVVALKFVQSKVLGLDIGLIRSDIGVFIRDNAGIVTDQEIPT